VEKRCVLVLGGDITDYRKAKSLIDDEDYVIFCDRGLRHLEALGVKPSLAVGDFDSVPVPEGVETVVFPPRKDDTDALCGLKEGLGRGYTTFLILGALGGRLDHEMGNLYLLDYLYSHGADGEIADGNTTVEIVGKEWKRVRSGTKYFSLIAAFGRAWGVYIEGAEYNLTDGVIDPSYQYGISNETRGENTRVRVEKGRLLLIRTED
jgi:thiamine pyrophosphokinase